MNQQAQIDSFLEQALPPRPEAPLYRGTKCCSLSSRSAKQTLSPKDRRELQKEADALKGNMSKSALQRRRDITERLGHG